MSSPTPTKRDADETPLEAEVEAEAKKMRGPIAAMVTYELFKEKFPLWTTPERPYHPGGCDRWDPSETYAVVMLDARTHRATGGCALKQVSIPCAVDFDDESGDLCATMQAEKTGDKHCIEAMQEKLAKTVKKLVFLAPFWCDDPKTKDDPLSFEMVVLKLSNEDLLCIRQQTNQMFKEEQVHGFVLVVVADSSECPDCTVLTPTSALWTAVNPAAHRQYSGAAVVTVDAGFVMDETDEREYVVEDGVTDDRVREYLEKYLEKKEKEEGEGEEDETKN